MKHDRLAYNEPNALDTIAAWLLALLWILPLLYAVWTAFHPPEYSTRFVLLAPLTLENFRRGRPVSYQTQVANAGYSLEDAVARFTMKNTGVFLQDTWTVTPRLTVSAGVRLDKIDIPERPLVNAALAAACAWHHGIAPESIFFTVVS